MTHPRPPYIKSLAGWDLLACTPHIYQSHLYYLICTGLSGKKLNPVCFDLLLKKIKNCICYRKLKSICNTCGELFCGGGLTTGCDCDPCFCCCRGTLLTGCLVCWGQGSFAGLGLNCCWGLGLGFCATGWRGCCCTGRRVGLACCCTTLGLGLGGWTGVIDPVWENGFVSII